MPEYPELAISVHSPQSGSSTDLVGSDGSGPLGRALAKHSPDLWQRLCERGGGRSTQGQSILTQNYKVCDKIGQGSTSVVYEAVRLNDGRKVALKTMRSADSEGADMAEKEYKLLRRFRHPAILNVMELQSVGGHGILVLELVEGLQLSHAVHESPRSFFSEGASRLLSASLLRGVEYLHRNLVLHCDIRPQNILVSQDLRFLKLLDFGSALPLSPPGATYTLPRGGHEVLCAAPEVVLGEAPSACSDVWQLGLCVFFMLSGRLPQKRDRCNPLREEVRAVATLHVSFNHPHWKEVSHSCKVVLRQCLAIDKHERPKPILLLEEDTERGSWFRWVEEEEDTRGGRTSVKNAVPTALLGGLEPLPADRDSRRKDCTGEQPQSPDGERPSSAVSAGTNQSTRASVLSTLAAPAEDDQYTEVVTVMPENEKATVLLMNYAERTCKVRMKDGTVRLVQAKDIRVN